MGERFGKQDARSAGYSIDLGDYIIANWGKK
jgi:hypothetical protein